MDVRALKAVLAIVVILGAFYVFKEEYKPVTTTTTMKTEATTSPLETTIKRATTTMPANPDALAECLIMATACKRDRCYYGNALNRHNTRFCLQIEDFRLRNLCAEKAGSNETIDKPLIEGQVFNIKDCGVYPGLPVEVRDEVENSTIASSNTNGTGEYAFEVATGGVYGIYVRIDEDLLNQNLSNISNRRYIVDFALS
ncbi:MAG: hypothetical protein V1703_01685 [Candidatus Altiarchaeota archaeon]